MCSVKIINVKAMTVAVRFQGVIKQKNAIIQVVIASPGRIANQSMVPFSASPIARLKTVSARLYSHHANSHQIANVQEGDASNSVKIQMMCSVKIINVKVMTVAARFRGVTNQLNALYQVVNARMTV